MHQGCGFDPRSSGYKQESNNECINKNNKSMFLYVKKKRVSKEILKTGGFWLPRDEGKAAVGHNLSLHKGKGSSLEFAC